MPSSGLSSRTAQSRSTGATSRQALRRWQARPWPRQHRKVSLALGAGLAGILNRSEPWERERERESEWEKEKKERERESFMPSFQTLGISLRQGRALSGWGGKKSGMLGRHWAADLQCLLLMMWFDKLTSMMSTEWVVMEQNLCMSFRLLSIAQLKVLGVILLGANDLYIYVYIYIYSGIANVPQSRAVFYQERKQLLWSFYLIYGYECSLVQFMLPTILRQKSLW